MFHEAEDLSARASDAILEVLDPSTAQAVGEHLDELGLTLALVETPYPDLELAVTPGAAKRYAEMDSYHCPVCNATFAAAARLQPAGVQARVCLAEEVTGMRAVPTEELVRFALAARSARAAREESALITGYLDE